MQYNFQFQASTAIRTVVQFHYTTWPDFGVPANVSAILNFVKLIKNWEADNTAPTIVHCRFVLLVIISLINLSSVRINRFFSNFSVILTKIAIQLLDNIITLNYTHVQNQMGIYGYQCSFPLLYA